MNFPKRGAGLFLFLLGFPVWSQAGSFFSPSGARSEAEILGLKPGLLWQAATGGALLGAPAAGEDGSIYCLSEDRYLYALDPSGRVKWKHYLRTLPLGNPSVGPDGSVYLTLARGELAAVNPSGQEIWRFDLGAPPAPGTAVSDEGLIYQGAQARLFCLDNRGRRRWQTELEAPLSGAAVIVPSWGLLCPLENRRLAALDLRGRRRWTLDTEGIPDQVLPDSERFYYSARPQTVAAASWQGEILWRRSLPRPVLSGLLLIQGRLWFITGQAGAGAGTLAAGEGRLHVVDPATGEDLAAPVPLTAGELFAGPALDQPGGGEAGPFCLTLRGELFRGEFTGGGISLFPEGLLESGGVSGVLLHPGGLWIENCRDWRIKAFALRPAAGPDESPPGEAAGEGKTGLEKTATPRWNQRSGGPGRRWAGEWPADSPRIPGNDELVLRTLAGTNSSEIQLEAIRQIRRGFREEKYGGEDWVLEILEGLAGEGLLNPRRENGRIVNDFSEVRRAAGTLLGEMGTFRSLGVLGTVLLRERETSVRQTLALAAARIGGDPGGGIHRALNRTFLDASLEERRTLAAAYLEALALFARYSGSLNPLGLEIISEIFRGDYSRELKAKALSLLSRSGA
ncbi:MAG: PQQ-like beta-propeller repeat protein [Spirochaetales bacterium]|nr:PQQ-like beta-propeller repeat protein [Spirochaetales bacterium]